MAIWASYTAENVVFASIGAVWLWGRLGRKELSIFGLGKLWKVFGFRPSSKAYEVAELVAFVGLGVIVGIAIARPMTAAQAITTGLGWTGLLAGPKHH